MCRRLRRCRCRPTCLQGASAPLKPSTRGTSVLCAWKGERTPFSSRVGTMSFAMDVRSTLPGSLAHARSVGLASNPFEKWESFLDSMGALCLLSPDIFGMKRKGQNSSPLPRPAFPRFQLTHPPLMVTFCWSFPFHDENNRMLPTSKKTQTE